MAVYIHAGFLFYIASERACQVSNEEMKYYFYWYNQFGAPCSAKRINEMPKHPNVIEEYEITKVEFNGSTLSTLAAKYPCTQIPDLT
jgi:hypothetical protein